MDRRRRRSTTPPWRGRPTRSCPANKRGGIHLYIRPNQRHRALPRRSRLWPPKSTSSFWRQAMTLCATSRYPNSKRHRSHQPWPHRHSHSRPSQHNSAQNQSPITAATSVDQPLHSIRHYHPHQATQRPHIAVTIIRKRNNFDNIWWRIRRRRRPLPLPMATIMWVLFKVVRFNSFQQTSNSHANSTNRRAVESRKRSSSSSSSYPKKPNRRNVKYLVPQTVIIIFCCVDFYILFLFE